MVIFSNYGDPGNFLLSLSDVANESLQSLSWTEVTALRQLVDGQDTRVGIAPLCGMASVPDVCLP